MTQADLGEGTFTAMLHEWGSLRASNDADLDAWEASLDAMRAEMLELRRRGRWRAGGLTLLRQLGLHHSELMLCRGLGWVLTPDGWHGLGDAFLRRFVKELGLPDGWLEDAAVSLEETRGVTRADIVLRYPGACVLIEAKVFATEQPEQADRLAREWDDEKPHLVYLTREGRAPFTAKESAGCWSTLRWSDLAVMASAVVSEGVPASPGALELFETWKNYGG